MSLQESGENGEDDLDESLTWQEIAEDNLNVITFKGIIEGFTLIEPQDEEERLPAQLLEVGNTILHMSSSIESVRSHKDDFRRLLDDATSLVIVFWRIYNESGVPGTLWPPPNLRNVTNKLEDTAFSIDKLMKRKSQENFVKRILVGYFGLRDLGKFKKYHRQLDDVALGFQNGLINITINGILREVIKDQARHQEEGEHSELSDNPVEEPVRRKARAADQEERPHLRKAKAKRDEVEESSEDEPVEEHKATKKTSRRQPEARTGPKGTKGTQKTRRGISTSGSEDKGKRTRYQESDEDVEEGTSRQRSRTNNATQSKTERRANPVYDDKEYDTDVPVVPKVQPKKKRPILTPEQKVQSAPMAAQYSISGFSFNNGSGNMINSNVGTIHNSTISDANNDNSVNTIPRGRRKPA